MCYHRNTCRCWRNQVKKALRASVITVAVSVLFLPFALATPEYTKKENKPCTFCHPAVGKPDLTDAGKYYKDHHTLEGYKEKKP
jgi:hypothetical protein